MIYDFITKYQTDQSKCTVLTMFKIFTVTETLTTIYQNSFTLCAMSDNLISDGATHDTSFTYYNDTYIHTYMHSVSTVCYMHIHILLVQW